MLKDGKYTIVFKTRNGESGGFLVLEEGKLVGGNNDYIYDGSYYRKGKATMARILVENYSGKETSIFEKAKYIWLKVAYMENKDGKGFHGKAFVVDTNPDVPSVVGAMVPISGKMLG